MKKLIIDGNNLVHRTYWVSKVQSQKAKLDCSEKISNLHIFFTLNAIFSYVTQFTPTVTYIVWDEKPEYRENLRKSEFKEYKGNRSKDSSPHQNNQVIKDMLSLLGIKSIFPRDLEADDVISYICRCHHPEYNSVIISADKDFLQLVNSKVSLYDPVRKTKYCNETFQEKTGYASTTDWYNIKCLLGDKSDNVPGIPRFTKRKISSFLSGSLILTSEETDIFNRNNKIFTLSRVDSMYEEQTYYSDQLKQENKADWKAFLLECNTRQFNNILKKREAWYGLFFLKDKLEEIFV